MSVPLINKNSRIDFDNSLPVNRLASQPVKAVPIEKKVLFGIEEEDLFLQSLFEKGSIDEDSAIISSKSKTLFPSLSREEIKEIQESTLLSKVSIESLGIEEDLATILHYLCRQAYGMRCKISDIMFVGSAVIKKIKPQKLQEFFFSHFEIEIPEALLERIYQTSIDIDFRLIARTATDELIKQIFHFYLIQFLCYKAKVNVDFFKAKMAKVKHEAFEKLKFILEGEDRFAISSIKNDKGPLIETIFARSLKRNSLLSQDAVFLNLHSFIDLTNNKVKLNENPKLEFETDGFSFSQALLDRLTKRIRIKNPNSVNAVGWGTLLACLVKGYVFVNPEDERIVRENLVKTYSSEGTIKITEIACILSRSVKSHCDNNPEAGVALFLNAVFLLSDNLSSEDLYKILELIPSVPRHGLLHSIYKELIEKRLDIKTAKELLACHAFFALHNVKAPNGATAIIRESRSHTTIFYGSKYKLALPYEPLPIVKKAQGYEKLPLVTKDKIDSFNQLFSFTETTLEHYKTGAHAKLMVEEALKLLSSESFTSIKLGYRLLRCYAASPEWKGSVLSFIKIAPSLAVKGIFKKFPFEILLKNTPYESLSVHFQLEAEAFKAAWIPALAGMDAPGLFQVVKELSAHLKISNTDLVKAYKDKSLTNAFYFLNKLAPSQEKLDLLQELSEKAKSQKILHTYQDTIIKELKLLANMQPGKKRNPIFMQPFCGRFIDGLLQIGAFSEAKDLAFYLMDKKKINPDAQETAILFLKICKYAVETDNPNYEESAETWKLAGEKKIWQNLPHDEKIAFLMSLAEGLAAIKTNRSIQKAISILAQLEKEKLQSDEVRRAYILKQKLVSFELTADYGSLTDNLSSVPAQLFFQDEIYPLFHKRLQEMADKKESAQLEKIFNTISRYHPLSLDLIKIQKSVRLIIENLDTAAAYKSLSNSYLTKVFQSNPEGFLELQIALLQKHLTKLDRKQTFEHALKAFELHKAHQLKIAPQIAEESLKLAEQILCDLWTPQKKDQFPLPLKEIYRDFFLKVVLSAENRDPEATARFLKYLAFNNISFVISKKSAPFFQLFYEAYMQKKLNEGLITEAYHQIIGIIAFDNNATATQALLLLKTLLHFHEKSSVNVYNKCFSKIASLNVQDRSLTEIILENFEKAWTNEKFDLASGILLLLHKDEWKEAGIRQKGLAVGQKLILDKDNKENYHALLKFEQAVRLEDLSILKWMIEQTLKDNQTKNVGLQLFADILKNRPCASNSDLEFRILFIKLLKQLSDVKILDYLTPENSFTEQINQASQELKCQFALTVLEGSIKHIREDKPVLLSLVKEFFMKYVSQGNDHQKFLMAKNLILSLNPQLMLMLLQYLNYEKNDGQDPHLLVNIANLFAQKAVMLDPKGIYLLNESYLDFISLIKEENYKSLDLLPHLSMLLRLKPSEKSLFSAHGIFIKKLELSPHLEEKAKSQWLDVCKRLMVLSSLQQNAKLHDLVIKELELASITNYLNPEDIAATRKNLIESNINVTLKNFSLELAEKSCDFFVSTIEQIKQYPAFEKQCVEKLVALLVRSLSEGHVEFFNYKAAHIFMSVFSPTNELKRLAKQLKDMSDYMSMEMKTKDIFHKVENERDKSIDYYPLLLEALMNHSFAHLDKHKFIFYLEYLNNALKRLFQFYKESHEPLLYSLTKKFRDLPTEHNWSFALYKEHFLFMEDLFKVCSLPKELNLQEFYEWLLFIGKNKPSEQIIDPEISAKLAHYFAQPTEISIYKASLLVAKALFHKLMDQPTADHCLNELLKVFHKLPFKQPFSNGYFQNLCVILFFFDKEDEKRKFDKEYEKRKKVKLDFTYTLVDYLFDISRKNFINESTYNFDKDIYIDILYVIKQAWKAGFFPNFVTLYAYLLSIFPDMSEKIIRFPKLAQDYFFIYQDIVDEALKSSPEDIKWAMIFYESWFRKMCSLSDEVKEYAKSAAELFFESKVLFNETAHLCEACHISIAKIARYFNLPNFEHLDTFKVFVSTNTHEGRMEAFWHLAYQMDQADSLPNKTDAWKKEAFTLLLSLNSNDHASLHGVFMKCMRHPNLGLLLTLDQEMEIYSTYIKGCLTDRSVDRSLKECLGVYDLLKNLLTRIREGNCSIHPEIFPLNKLIMHLFYRDKECEYIGRVLTDLLCDRILNCKLLDNALFETTVPVFAEGNLEERMETLIKIGNLIDHFLATFSPTELTGKQKLFLIEFIGLNLLQMIENSGKNSKMALEPIAKRYMLSKFYEKESYSHWRKYYSNSLAITTLLLKHNCFDLDSNNIFEFADFIAVNLQSKLADEDIIIIEKKLEEYLADKSYIGLIHYLHLLKQNLPLLVQKSPASLNIYFKKALALFSSLPDFREVEGFGKEAANLFEIVGLSLPYSLTQQKGRNDFIVKNLQAFCQTYLIIECKNNCGKDKWPPNSKDNIITRILILISHYLDLKIFSSSEFIETLQLLIPSLEILMDKTPTKYLFFSGVLIALLKQSIINHNEDPIAKEPHTSLLTSWFKKAAQRIEWRKVTIEMMEREMKEGILYSQVMTRDEIEKFLDGNS